MARQRRDSASQVMKRMKYDPLKALIRHAQKEELLDAEDVSICMKLMDFAYPKLRSVEQSGEITARHKVTVVVGGSDD